MIRKITSEKDESNKAGWTFDKKAQVWFTWEVDVTQRGKRIRQRGFSTEKKAKDFADDLKMKKKLTEFGIIQPEKLPTVEALFARHLETITHPKLKPNARRTFEMFLSCLPRNLTLTDLRKAHFREYCDKRLSDQRQDKVKGVSGVKPSTVRRELIFVSAAIHKAGDYFPQCENWNPPKVIMPAESKERTARVIEDDERMKVLDYLLEDRRESEREKHYVARRRVGLTFYFAFLTGLRHGEICALEKANLDAGKRRLKARRMKTEKSGIGWTVFEPLQDEHLWTLSEAAKLYPESKYFFSFTGKKPNKNYIIMKEAAARLGVNYGSYKEGGFVFHSARHTFATALETNGVDRTTSRGFTGHTKDEMFSRYAHVTTDSRTKALQTVEKKFSIHPESRKLTPAEIFQKVRDKEMELAEFEMEISKLVSVFGEVI